MTTFRKHDRVRALEDGPHTVKAENRLIAGKIYTVSAVFPEALGRFTLSNHEGAWRQDLFELVEHAVAEDRCGEPLYVGDEVVWGSVDPLTPGAIVQGGSIEKEEVHVDSRGNPGAAHRSDIWLDRHHWEKPLRAPWTPQGQDATAPSQPEPTDPLTAAFGRFSRTWEDYQKQERERLATAVEGVSKALRAVVDARAEQLREPEWMPALATGTTTRWQYQRDGTVVRFRPHPDDAPNPAIVTPLLFEIPKED